MPEIWKEKRKSSSDLVEFVYVEKPAVTNREFKAVALLKFDVSFESARQKKRQGCAPGFGETRRILPSRSSEDSRLVTVALRW